MSATCWWRTVPVLTSAGLPTMPLNERASNDVTWQGWEAIAADESQLGEALGRPRVKLVRLEELTDVAAHG